MAMNRPNHSGGQDKFVQLFKGTVLLGMLAALSYVAVGIAQHAPFLLDVASEFALESQT